jgi:hypothetical protein
MPVVVNYPPPSSVVVNEVTGAVTVVAAGPRGVQGVQGPAATVAVGTVATGAPGSDATVTNSGTSGAAVLDFAIPRGDVGEQGQQGIQGIQGVPGNAATVTAGTTTTGAPGSSASVTNSGTSSAAVFDFAIPEGVQGQQGIQGIPGDAATVAAGTTTTGAAGSSASVTNSGSSSAAVFDFTIPQGIQGVQGIQGIQGVKGDTGEGVAIGGTAGQILTKASSTNYDTAWQHPAYSWTYSQAGFYVSHPPQSTTTFALTNKRTFCTPIFFPRPTAIDRISVRITTAGSAGSLIRFGLYEDIGAYPGALLTDFGTIDGTIVDTAVEVTISTTVQGLVWFAARASDAATRPTVIAYAGGTNPITMGSNSPAVQTAGWLSATESPADQLPDPFPSPANGAGVSNSGPVMRVRIA